MKILHHKYTLKIQQIHDENTIYHENKWIQKCNIYYEKVMIIMNNSDSP